MTSATYDRAYNAALVGAPVASQARWADDFVLDGLDPEVLVLGVSPLDLLDVNPLDLLDVTSGQGRSQAVQAAFDDTLDRLKPSAGQQLEERASDASALIRHRSSLRNPGTLGRALSDTLNRRPPREGIPAVATVENGEVVPRDLTFWQGNLRPSGGTRSTTTAAWPRPATPPSRGAWRWPRPAPTSRSTACAPCSTPPSNPDAGRSSPCRRSRPRPSPRSPGRRSGWPTAWPRCRLVADEYDVELLDFALEGYPLDAFADVAHLNRLGSERYSRELAVALDATS